MATPSSSLEGLPEQGGADDKLSTLFTGATRFAVDNDTWFAEARIKAAFYPKFDNENSDQEVRGRQLPLPCGCLLDCSLLPSPCDKQCQLLHEPLLGAFPRDYFGGSDHLILSGK
jgi:hypothetical protein